MKPLDIFKYINNPNEYNKDHDLALRNLFGKEIKPNFLIKVFHKVIDELKFDLNKYILLFCEKDEFRCDFVLILMKGVFEKIYEF